MHNWMDCYESMYSCAKIFLLKQASSPWVWNTSYLRKYSFREAYFSCLPISTLGKMFFFIFYLFIYLFVCLFRYNICFCYHSDLCRSFKLHRQLRAFLIFSQKFFLWFCYYVNSCENSPTLPLHHIV